MALSQSTPQLKRQISRVLGDQLTSPHFSSGCYRWARKFQSEMSQMCSAQYHFIRHSGQELSYALRRCYVQLTQMRHLAQYRVPEFGAELQMTLSDLLRWWGLGPLIKWVDDFLFARIQKERLAEYIARCRAARNQILARGGGIPLQKCCRIWWEGAENPDETQEEFAERMEFDIVDLSGRSPQSDRDAQYTYASCDIEHFSAKLGVPWSAKKTREFSSVNVYIGFSWNVDAKTIALTEEKRVQYLENVREWLRVRPKSLGEAQKLHGRLQHICYIIPSGRAYLLYPQRFMGLFDDTHGQWKKLTPPRRLPNDLQ